MSDYAHKFWGDFDRTVENYLTADVEEDESEGTKKQEKKCSSTSESKYYKYIQQFRRMKRKEYSKLNLNEHFENVKYTRHKVTYNKSRCQGYINHWLYLRTSDKLHAPRTQAEKEAETEETRKMLSAQAKKKHEDNWMAMYSRGKLQISKGMEKYRTEADEKSIQEYFYGKFVAEMKESHYRKQDGELCNKKCKHHTNKSPQSTTTLEDNVHS